MSVRKILALTDLSESSERGLDWAGALAGRLGGKVCAGYVQTRFDRFAALTGGDRENAVQLTSVLRETSERQLQERADALVPHGVRAGVEVVECPSVREGVAALVEQTAPDLVCLASHGHTGLKHVVLGSIAEHTLRTAGVPVLVVKQTPPPPAEKALRILLALDLGDGSEQLVAETARLLGPDDELALAHVVESIYWAPGLYGTEFTLPQPDVPRLREVALEQMRRIPLPSPAPRMSYHAVAGRPGQELVALQKDLGAHVTVVHTHGRRGFDRLVLGSVAEYVARRSPGAVYVVPAT